MTTAESVLETCRQRGIELQAVGDQLRFRGADLDDSIRLMLKMHKIELLGLLAPKAIGCAWREDEKGRLWFSDGTTYAPTRTGGWVLVKHPTRKMREPGTVEVVG